MSLDVYLYGEPIGALFQTDGVDYRFAYSEGALERYGRGVGLLSTALPTTDAPFSADTTRAYVEGLLPEGPRRSRLARELGLEPDDGYGLIAALGRDCVGGVVFVPRDEAPPEAVAQLDWAGDEELEELVAAPPPRYFDPARPRRMRAVLPGVRHKLALARPRPGGPWAWPTPDLPSTHIVKPETGEYPEMVANEMFCTTVAAAAGLLVVPCAMETIGGRRCIVVERFDRTEDRPVAGRFHQESFCQALSFAPGLEPDDEDADGPGFAEACGLLRAIGEERSAADLLAASLCNYILGNGDSHGRNFALMVVHDGALPAPFYDLFSTAVYDDPLHVGLTIAEDYSETAYLLELAQVAEEAEIDFTFCRHVAAEVSTKMTKAIELVAAQAQSEGWCSPVVEAIVDLAAPRALNLGYEVQC